MGSVDRADYMDNFKVAEVTESIRKERALQRKGIEAQERSGKLAAWAPPPPPPRQTLEERVGLPPYLAPTLQDPAAARALALSRELWSNTLPGYLVQDGRRMASTMQADYTWDEAAIDEMKAQRFLDKTHNRRRDEHTRYVEARAMHEALAGK